MKCAIFIGWFSVHFSLLLIARSEEWCRAVTGLELNIEMRPSAGQHLGAEGSVGLRECHLNQESGAGIEDPVMTLKDI